MIGQADRVGRPVEPNNHQAARQGTKGRGKQGANLGRNAGSLGETTSGAIQWTPTKAGNRSEHGHDPKAETPASRSDAVAQATPERRQVRAAARARAANPRGTCRQAKVRPEIQTGRCKPVLQRRHGGLQATASAGCESAVVWREASRRSFCRKAVSAGAPTAPQGTTQWPPLATVAAILLRGSALRCPAF